ncbi:MAG: glycosyltransferase, partial [Akkermansiaceae bacterium]|nr:glycosyltransferase [Verrucomicrobiales bacterium]
MRIALVSKTNGPVGGASYFAENLGAWLLEAGHEVVHYCVFPKHELRAYQRQLPCVGVQARLVRHLNWRARQLGLVEPLPWEYWFGLRQLSGDFDLIHFHDLYMAISPRTLQAIARRQPVVLTAHDCSAFTGGCINPLGCKRFHERCGACPQAEALGRFDFTGGNLKLVRRLARCKNIAYVFPSRWIEQEASRSLSFASPASHIPNGFDSRNYRLRSREAARSILGIGAEQKVVIVSSSSLDNKLKGVIFALRALAANKDLNPLALLIGHPSPAVEAELAGVSTRLEGFVEDRERLGLLFAAADLLLYPSL